MNRFIIILMVIILFSVFVFALDPLNPGYDRKDNVDLAKEYDLSLKDKQGDVDYYKMRTIYYHGNSTGIIQNRDELISSFKREVLKVSKDSHTVKYIWKSSKFGHSTSPYGEIMKWEALSFSDGITYQINFLSPDYFLSTVDIKPIPKTLVGMKFWVKIMDAHAQFELLRTESGGNISQLKKTGDRVASPGAEQTGGWDFPPLITDSHFTNGGYETIFTGLCLLKGKKCGVLEYVNTDSKLSCKTQLNPASVFDQEGTSNFWGHIYVDLESGKLIKGDLYEYVVVQIKNPVFFPQPLRLFERRLVEIWKIQEEEFEKD